MNEIPSLSRKVLTGGLFAGLLALSFVIVQPFLASIAWAMILCYVTWPAYARLRGRLNNRANLSALLMTVLLASALVIPMAWMVLLLESEVVSLYQAATQKIASGTLTLPDSLRNLPVVGHELARIADRITGNPEALNAELARWFGNWRDEITGLIGGVGKNIAKLGFALLTAFFLYRDGEHLLGQVTLGLRQLFGGREKDYLEAAGATTRAVVYGIVLTALAQGALAGVGYLIFGAPNPVFLAAITTLVALIPFGTPFAWGSVAVWMAVDGNWAGAIGLAIWGTVLVSWIDNIIRPLVISSATHIPFMVVMFGVLGGLAAFGMVGLFVGPVILAVFLAVWREWLEDQAEDSERSV